MAKRDYYNTDAYLKNIKYKQSISEASKPIIDTYWKELRAKVKPTVQEIPETADDSQFRAYIMTQVSPILKQQSSAFVEHLSKAHDLKPFYKFSKPFLDQVKDVKNLDSGFLITLWNKYKQKMLIQADQSNMPRPSTMSAGEYEAALRHGRKVISQNDLENPELVIHDNKPQVVSYPHLKEIVVKGSDRVERAAMGANDRDVPGDKWMTKKKYHISKIPKLNTNLPIMDMGPRNLTESTEKLFEKVPYGYKQKYNLQTKQNETTNIPRKGPTTNIDPLAMKIKADKKARKRLHSGHSTTTTDSLSSGVSGSGLIGVPHIARR
jgi:hypothetical protein